ncbi:MAG: DUF2141 domain-containing protein [Flavobacteriaceae bacterium]
MSRFFYFYLKIAMGLHCRLFLLWISISTAHTFAQHRLEIEVENIEQLAGTFFLSIFDNQNDFDNNSIQSHFFQKTPVRANKLKVIFDSLPEGKYAIKAYHDANNNQRLDKTWVGLPKEKYGFSNNVIGVMGPPSFSQSAFEVKGVTKHTLFLR